MTTKMTILAAARAAAEAAAAAVGNEPALSTRAAEVAKAMGPNGAIHYYYLAGGYAVFNSNHELVKDVKCDAFVLEELVRMKMVVFSHGKMSDGTHSYSRYARCPE